jgi:DNA modification methylase
MTEIETPGHLTPSAPVGRGLLAWEGKRLLDPIPLKPVHAIESFGDDRSDPGEKGNRIYHGDNLSVLAHLVTSGLRNAVRLIYIDPPFGSNADYMRKVRLRNGRSQMLGQQVQYTDTWEGDSYLQFMYERLLILRDLLADDGSIWLHCDYRQVHRLHLLLEEVFGEGNYLNTIAWRSQVTRGAKVNAFYFPFSTQYIEIFAKDRTAPTLWHPQKKELLFTRRQAVAQFMEDDQGFFRTSDPGTYSFEKLVELNALGRLYAPYEGEIVVNEHDRRVYPSNGGNIGVKYYLQALDNGRYAVKRGVDNLWDDIPGLGTTPGEDVGYPTQKTEALLRRVIAASTNPGDMVLDCFMGSGTTLAVAQKMGRSWIGCDANYGSVQTTRRRLQRMKADEAKGSDEPDFSIWKLDSTATDRPASGDDPLVQVEVQIRRLAGEPSTIEVVVQGKTTPALVNWMGKRRSSASSTIPYQEIGWREVVDAIEIDLAYDGLCYRPTMVDAPQKRRAQVEGRYELSIDPSIGSVAHGEPTRVAVRITDVLGHEMMVVCSL